MYRGEINVEESGQLLILRSILIPIIDMPHSTGYRYSLYIFMDTGSNLAYRYLYLKFSQSNVNRYRYRLNIKTVLYRYYVKSSFDN
jgi:hypothetical protein